MRLGRHGGGEQEAQGLKVSSCSSKERTKRVVVFTPPEQPGEWIRRMTLRCSSWHSEAVRRTGRRRRKRACADISKECHGNRRGRAIHCRTRTPRSALRSYSGPEEGQQTWPMKTVSGLRQACPNVAMSHSAYEGRTLRTRPRADRQSRSHSPAWFLLLQR